MLVAIFILKNGVAQRVNNKKFIVSYGMNIVFEERDQFVNYINNEEVLWNISPITFGVEKRLNNIIGICGNIGSNLYPEKQKISGITLNESRDVFYFDFYGKLNFTEILKYKSPFDPYITAGTGYYYRSVANEINLNLGAGFNYWLNDKYGINFSSFYKINQPIVSENTQGDLIQVSFMLIQLID